MIYVGENKALICKGDRHPAALYKGNKKISGYTLTEFSGEGNITLTDCYNDRVYDVVTDAESVTVRGKNILDMSKYPARQGYYTDTGGSLNTSSTSLTAISPIPVEPNTQYTITSNIALRHIWFATSEALGGQGVISRKNGRIFTTPENCKYILVSLNAPFSNFKWAMLEKGEGDGIYEPYIEPKTIAAGEEIPTFFGTTVIEAEGAISGKYKKQEDEA